MKYVHIRKQCLGRKAKLLKRILLSGQKSKNDAKAVEMVVPSGLSQEENR